MNPLRMKPVAGIEKVASASLVVIYVSSVLMVSQSASFADDEIGN